MLSKEDIQTIRNIIKDVIYEILDTEVYDPLFQLVNGMDAGIVEFKQTLKKLKLETYDVNKIKWQQAEGVKGVYEKATIDENKDNPDFKAMVKDLADHSGKMTKDAYFCWLFKNGSLIGRKKRK